MPPGVAAQNIGAGPCRGETCCDMLEAMPCIAPSQPSGAMALITPCSQMVPVVNKKYQCGDMLEAMVCIAPSQPNEAMAHITIPTVPMASNIYHSTRARFLGLDLKLSSKVQMD